MSIHLVPTNLTGKHDGDGGILKENIGLQTVWYAGELQSKKRIMLTGGAGFLGSFVTEKLKAMPVPHKRYAHQAAKARGCKHIFIPKEQDYDLTPQRQWELTRFR